MDTLHIIYLVDGRMLLSRKEYRDWRAIQDEFDGYMTSLGPWTVDEVIQFLDTEYPPGPTPDLRDTIRRFTVSAEETLAL